jgi:2-polyprenyl-3-methyl-5-hydroxy-6-metoxy-1,4-benzoquinol methylase
MSRNIVRKNKCRLCGGRGMELVLQLTPTPLADSYVTAEKINHAQETYPLDVALCRDCGNVQLLDAVSPEILYSNFIYETATSPGLVEHFQKAADGILRRLNPPKNAFVIDIGSNDGSLLEFFKSKGLNVQGIEPAKEIAKKVNESGITTLPAFFTEVLAQKIKKEYGSAYLITANNTIANIDDLDDMAEGISNLLAPNGVFVFETGYLLDLVQKLIFDNIYHEHLSYFSVKPLQRFFHNNRMELIDVERIPTKGGSLRCFVQHKNAPRKTEPSVHNLIKLEEEFGLHSPKTFKALADKLNNARNELKELLDGLKAKGKKIAGYGASHSVTTLLYHFDIGKMLNFIVDDKVGLGKLGVFP